MWFVLPVFILTGVVLFNLTGKDALQLAQVAPTPKENEKATSLEFKPAPDETKKQLRNPISPAANTLPRIQKTSAVVAQPAVKEVEVPRQEESRANAFPTKKVPAKKEKNTEKIKTIAPIKKTSENTKTHKKETSIVPPVKAVSADKPVAEKNSDSEISEQNRMKKELSKVHVTLTPKKQPEEKAVVAALPGNSNSEVLTDGTSSPALLQDAKLNFKMGVFYQRTGDPIEALDYYNKALQLDPFNAEIYNNRSLIYKELGKYDKAVAGFLKAIHYDPTYVKAYNNIGLLYLHKKNHSAAIANFRKAIAIDPQNLESYNNLASVYKKQDNPVKARELYQIILKKNPKQLEAHYNLALLYEQEGDYPNAIAHYNRFVELGANLRPKLVTKVKTHLNLLQ